MTTFSVGSLPRSVSFCWACWSWFYKSLTFPTFPQYCANLAEKRVNDPNPTLFWVEEAELGNTSQCWRVNQLGFILWFSIQPMYLKSSWWAINVNISSLCFCRQESSPISNMDEFSRDMKWSLPSALVLVFNSFKESKILTGVTLQGAKCGPADFSREKIQKTSKWKPAKQAWIYLGEWGSWKGSGKLIRQ